MPTLPPSTLVFVATERIDGRKGIDGLSSLVRSQFQHNPLSGHLFVFFSRNANRVQILHWDRNGYVLTIKRLERGTFRVPLSPHSLFSIEAAELLLVLEGIELTGARRRPRWIPGAQR